MALTCFNLIHCNLGICFSVFFNIHLKDGQNSSIIVCIATCIKFLNFQVLKTKWLLIIPYQPGRILQKAKYLRCSFRSEIQNDKLGSPYKNPHKVIESPTKSERKRDHLSLKVKTIFFKFDIFVLFLSILVTTDSKCF